MSIVVSALVTAALAEIKVARAGNAVSPDDADLALQLFNELLDRWNITGRALYASSQSTFVLTPSLQPHTIGIAANAPTFAVSVARPARIPAINLILPSGSVRVPITPRDKAWWMNVRARVISSAIPTDYYYEPSWPNGAINCWPIPNLAYSVELQLDTLLAQVLWADTLDLPMGYQAALRLSLAEICASPFGQTLTSETKHAAMEARAAVFGTNDTIPTINTRDAGMPGGGGGGWDYRTGLVE